jgi:hypothetical protein
MSALTFAQEARTVLPLVTPFLNRIPRRQGPQNIARVHHKSLVGFDTGGNNTVRMVQVAVESSVERCEITQTAQERTLPESGSLAYSLKMVEERAIIQQLLTQAKTHATSGDELGAAVAVSGQYLDLSQWNALLAQAYERSAAQPNLLITHPETHRAIGRALLAHPDNAFLTDEIIAGRNPYKPSWMPVFYLGHAGTPLEIIATRHCPQGVMIGLTTNLPAPIESYPAHTLEIEVDQDYASSDTILNGERQSQAWVVETLKVYFLGGVVLLTDIPL